MLGPPTSRFKLVLESGRGAVCEKLINCPNKVSVGPVSACDLTTEAAIVRLPRSEQVVRDNTVPLNLLADVIVVVKQDPCPEVTQALGLPV